MSEETSERQDLDPRTASVGFHYWNYGSPEEMCVGRRYHWFYPTTEAGWVWDDELRDKHPEIDDATWEGLFAAAFHRGEFGFLKSIDAETRQRLGRDLFLGYQFGPPGAREIAGADPQFQNFLDSCDLSDD